MKNIFLCNVTMMGIFYSENTWFLEKATRAELVLEKIQSHEDSKLLRVSINRNPSILVPVAKNIPDPEADYMHHTYPLVDIPLAQLREGLNNTFRLDVDTVQRWSWPQNLIDGVISQDLL